MVSRSPARGSSTVPIGTPQCVMTECIIPPVEGYSGGGCRRNDAATSSLSARQRDWKSEPRQDRPFEASHGADAVLGELEDDETNAVPDNRGRVEVCAERWLAIRSRRHEIEPSARTKDASAELGDET